MGFLTLFDGTVVLDAITGAEIDEAEIAKGRLPEWWVRIKKTVANAAYEKAQEHLVGDQLVEAKADDVENASVSNRPNVLAYQRELVLAALDEWNLTDKNDVLLPIANLEDRKRSLAVLPPATFTAIYKVISKYNNPRTDLEAATFPDAGNVGGARGSEVTAVDDQVPSRVGALEAAGA